jgi:acetate kinase
MNVLSLNAGSSSLKFALHQVDSVLESCLMRGQFDRLGSEAGALSWDTGTETFTQPVPSIDLSAAVHRAIQVVQASGPIDAIGCRVVHGGANFRQPTRVDASVLAEIEALSPLAPLHNARDVATMRAGQAALPNVPVIAVFDTAFHACIPQHAYQYGLPNELASSHSIRRYGFHGISYAHVVRTLMASPQGLPKRLVICHLGSGASVCAVLDGISIDTSMGFTPLEGLLMGTRSGDIDPGVLLYLLREQHLSTTELDDLLNRKSGLLGTSGLSADMRDLEQAAQAGNASAKAAIDLFCYRIVKYVGAYAAALGGLDALVFSGGIGEHSQLVRQSVCAPLSFLGIRPEADDCDPSQGSTPVWVVSADEERQIAFESAFAV